ncbi:hypothetical protein A9P82_00800 [Arachidicoccus ginsenosidimutans]|uniref:NTF2-like N-terminal transpeptidase domain-containing protein n=1 Tax=Arachidicoccus sp. BS20 TaxID=1850526 RepID=UPI0007F174BF|nr:NTF2-like N-terminal transpeptidase domain-containing protein [Arachidicoccus sp. BS20]ANI87982.1 hypothetical protein A9P82_00800 [Arachidicoccus sp. BS20]
MKRAILGFFVFLSVVTIFSCKQASTPSSVAEKFAKAMNTQDFTSAKSAVTAESEGFFSQIEGTIKNGQLPDSIQAFLKQETVKASNEKKINDSTYSVDITLTFPHEIMGTKVQTQTFILKKEKGEWKIDLQATMQKAMEEMGPQQDSVQMPSDDTLPPLPTAPDSSEK